jgi:hypothetical protein
VKWLVDQPSTIVSGRYGGRLAGRGSNEVTGRSTTTGAHRSRSDAPAGAVVTGRAGDSLLAVRSEWTAECGAGAREAT